MTKKLHPAILFVLGWLFPFIPFILAFILPFSSQNYFEWFYYSGLYYLLTAFNGEGTWILVLLFSLLSIIFFGLCYKRGFMPVASLLSEIMVAFWSAFLICVISNNFNVFFFSDVSPLH